MKILLIGPQGSGKSTQAKLLGEYLKVPVISTGDIFRKLIQEDTDLGRTLKNILSEGKLVDDQTTSKIVQQKLSEPSYQNGFVMDGYPRNIEQVNIFDPKFE
ncbi:nucleoside monophosphate kinase, partial [Patescibacteria group bacterium]|nr:nucleoside monophosphate kinase [Patescibacteria group bacterium]